MERLYWTNPRAKTAIAQVTGHRAGGFTLDKSIYHAATKGYHHEQPPDLGHVLADGHKLKLAKVAWRNDALIHYTDGPLPSVGARAQLHLDAPRRELQARAHAALHILITAAGESRAEFLSPPRLVGGAEARLHIRPREDPRVALPKILARAQQIVAAREAITTRWMPRDEAASRLPYWPVPLADIMPDEPTLRIVNCGEKSRLPCDAPMPTHTWEVGEMRLALVQPRDGGVRFGVKVY